MDEIRDDDVERVLAAFGAAIPYYSFEEPCPPLAMPEVEPERAYPRPTSSLSEAVPFIAPRIPLAPSATVDQGDAAPTHILAAIFTAAPAPALPKIRGPREAVPLPARREPVLQRLGSPEPAASPTPLSEVFQALGGRRVAGSPSDSLHRQLCRL
jgi:hypothetical protein